MHNGESTMGKTKLAKELKEKTSLPRVKTPELKLVGKLEGQYWVWPDGTKTHLRFIKEAVMKKRALPKGIYAAAEKLNLPNLNHLMRKAKSLGLKDSVEK